MTAQPFRGVRHAVTMFLVAVASLLLLIYVGHGEAQRNYFKFVLDGVLAQGRLVQNPLESYLRAGLPLRQYAGFTTSAKLISDSDDAISAIFVADSAGAVVFTSGGQMPPLLPATASVAMGKSENVDVRRSNGFYQIVLPLRDKFEIVGSLVIVVPRAAVSARVESSFRPLVLVAVGLSALFTLVVSFGRRPATWRVGWLPAFYGLAFMSMAAVVVATLLALYSDGVQTKTRALADSLAQRLRDIVTFNLNFDQFDGVDRMFDEYRKLNPEISAAALKVNGRVQIHTNPEQVGRHWMTDRSAYEYSVDLSHPSRSANKVEVVVALPMAIVYDQVLHTIKNFAALFAACGFLAWMLLQLAGVLHQVQQGMAGRIAGNASPNRNDAAFDLVKPIFFMAVFIEHLAYPFLPQLVLAITSNSGLSDGFVSTPFIAYYLCFALTLIPAGHFSQLYGPRRLMFGGLLFAALGLLGLVVVKDFGSLVLVRAIAGIGQGMLFIGAQSYLIETAAPERRTQGAAVIVFGFQGGMISGTAIGSLLVGYIGMSGVLWLAGCVAIIMAICTICLIPRGSQHSTDPLRGLDAWRRLGHDLARVLPSAEFLRTMILVGLPTKAVMTGVVFFALPLILSRMGHAPENIGQVIMLYAIGVLLASNYSSRLVDRTGRTEVVLFWGTAASGIGLMLIGLIEWPVIAATTYGSTLVLVVGVLALGVAHGFMYAPVVTRVAECRVSQAIGENSVVATYRFLERIGHLAGPIIVGQLFLIAGHSAVVVAWIGGAILVLGGLYLMRLQLLPSGTQLRGPVK